MPFGRGPTGSRAADSQGSLHTFSAYPSFNTTPRHALPCVLLETVYGTVYGNVYGTLYGTLYGILYGILYGTIYATRLRHPSPHPKSYKSYMFSHIMQFELQTP